MINSTIYPQETGYITLEIIIICFAIALIIAPIIAIIREILIYLKNRRND